MLSLTYIYALLAPESDEIRYVGKANDPWKRLKEHLTEATHETHHRANWLKLLMSQGHTPRLEIVAEVPVAEWKCWERYYIQYFRDSGFNLVNTAEGGDGDGVGSGGNNPNFGKPAHPNTRAALLASNIGRRKTPEEVEKIRATLKGRQPPAAVLAAAIKANTGKPRSLKTRALIGAANHAAAARKRDQKTYAAI